MYCHSLSLILAPPDAKNYHRKRPCAWKVCKSYIIKEVSVFLLHFWIIIKGFEFISLWSRWFQSNSIRRSVITPQGATKTWGMQTIKWKSWSKRQRKWIQWVFDITEVPRFKLFTKKDTLKNTPEFNTTPCTGNSPLKKGQDSFYSHWA